MCEDRSHHDDNRVERGRTLLDFLAEVEPDPHGQLIMLIEAAAVGCAVHLIRPKELQDYLGEFAEQLHLEMHAPHLARVQ